MPFTTELKADFVRGSRHCRLLEPLTYVGSRTITAPAGFETDFASIPRMLWFWLSPDDPEIRDAAVIHDYLYVIHEEGSRKEADALLSEMMDSLSASAFTRAAVWMAVRLGGAGHWID